MNSESKLAGTPEFDPRVQLATERTLLAWIRTGLAMMAFGFVVARFSIFLQALGVKSSQISPVQATILGVVMVGLGIVINVVAPFHYRSYYRRIRASGARQYSAWSLTVFIALALAVVGTVLLLYLVMVDLRVWQDPQINTGLN